MRKGTPEDVKPGSVWAGITGSRIQVTKVDLTEKKVEWVYVLDKEDGWTDTIDDFASAFDLVREAP